MTEKIASAYRKYRWPLIGLLVVVSVLAAAGTRHLRFDNSLEVWFLEGDPGIQRYRGFLKLFGTDEMVVVAWRTEDAFSRDNIERLRRMEKELAGVQYVERVVSLASVAVPRDEDDELAIGPLFDPLPDDPELMALRRRAALQSPFLTSSLVSPDGKACALVVEIAHREGEFEYKRSLLTAVEQIMARESAASGLVMHLAGTATLDRAFFDYTERDMLFFLPLLFVAICVTVLVLFRRAAAVVIPLCVVFISLLWTLGLQGWLGWKITVVSSILGPLIMAMGIADAIHVLSEYMDQLQQGVRRRLAAVQAMLIVFRPCFFTSLTTAAGFLSLLVSPIRPVREMGVLAAAGVLMTFVVTIILVPITLSLVKAPPARYMERMKTGRVSRFLAWLKRGSRQRDLRVVAVSTGLVIVAAVGVGRMDIGTNMLEFFREDDPARRAVEEVDQLIGGTISVEHLIEADGEHGFLTPDRLARLDRFSAYMRSQPNVTGVHSLVELLKELDAAVRGVPADQGRVPDNRPLIAQYMMLLESNAEVQRLYKKGGRYGRLSLRVSMEGSQVLTRKVPELDRFRETEIHSAGFALPSTGMVPLMNRMERFLLQSQLESFGLALLVISLMMILLLRSVKLGLFGMIPNLAPVLLTLGVMGYAGIRMDIATVMIASVVLGLVVDDSIHLLSRLQRQLPLSGGDLDLAVAESIRTVGHPILVTTLVLTLGFWTLLFASFKPNVYFGLLSGLTVLMALAADLIFLPAVLRLVRPKL